VMQATGMAAIADDSGLAVDALGGAPGVYSARYGGQACRSDDDRNKLLLENMQAVPDDARTAHYVSVITCCMPDGSVVSARGECSGRILREEIGTGGFGYDPLFYSDDAQMTFGVLDPDTKNNISHRGRALALFADKMKEKLNADK
ncbi:MAG: non-canonical purine NTP pyrophosphatase, partial [Oscillospiraceae bacterium]|nr:non-canonical purine NTP pyrophosphatase [Oscillospiraceae bacterium]